MIAIMGSPRELQVRVLADHLSRLGVPPAFFDSESFPARQKIAFDLDGVRIDGVPVGEIRALYVRHLNSSPDAPSSSIQKRLDIDWHAESVALREKGTLLRSLIDGVERSGGTAVNPNNSISTCQKPFQLQLLKREGIPVPDTLITNSPEEVREFCLRHPRVIYKPVTGGATTREVTPEDLTLERLELLRSAPVIFQEFIPGENIRAYVVGGRLVAAGLIHTRDELDFRRAEAGVDLLRLPDRVEAFCLKAAQACALRFTAIDLKRDGNRWVLLECNSSPMFVGFDEKSGAQVGQALAGYLAAC